MTSREVADALEPLIDRLYIAGAISRDELKVLLAAQSRLEGDAAVEARLASRHAGRIDSSAR